MRRVVPLCSRFIASWTRSGLSVDDVFGDSISNTNPLRPFHRDSQQDSLSSCTEELDDDVVASSSAEYVESRDPVVMLDEQVVLPYFPEVWNSNVAERGWPFGGSCGFVIDCDGVIYRSGTIVPGSDIAVRYLVEMKIPFVFLTNNGSRSESELACYLSKLLGVEIATEQVVCCHSPMRLLVPRYKDSFVLVAGGGSVATTLREYGMTHLCHVRDFQRAHPELVPFMKLSQGSETTFAGNEPLVQAVIVAGDLEDVFNDTQIILDVVLDAQRRQAIPLYWHADDLLWAAKAAASRLGGGAAREMFCSVFRSLTGYHPKITMYGKPRMISFSWAEKRLHERCRKIGWNPSDMRTVCMVGDCISTDIVGANAMGGRWLSVHVQSGVALDEPNHRSPLESDIEMEFIRRQSVIPHYIAPSLDHFVREVIHLGENVITLNKRVTHGPINPIDLKAEYGWV